MLAAGEAAAEKPMGQRRTAAPTHHMREPVRSSLVPAQPGNKILC